MFWTILLFLVLLSVLVLAHEWGHYAAARRAGMKVEEFGIGFPPRIFALKGKDGMRWSFNVIPLGGFVKIKGEGGEDRTDADSFAHKSIWRRFTVLIAGVVMNIVLAAVLFSAGFMFGLPAIIDDEVKAKAEVTDLALHIMEIVPESPAAAAGLKVGDRIISIDGQPYASDDEARAAMAPSGNAIEMVVARGGDVQTIEVTPAFVESVGREAVGIAIVETGFVRYPFYLAPILGAVTALQSTWDVVVAFAGLLAGLFTKQDVAAEVSGPVGIAVLTGQVAELGFMHLVQFAAMLSVNLAVINILPFPALDGGRIVFLAIEALRRKPNSQRLEQAFHAAGFLLLMLLVLVVTYRDIVNFF